jgi:branched-chain amino acid transport system permease protein
MNRLKQAVSSIGLRGTIVIVFALALIVVPLVVDLGNYILTVLVSLLIFITLSESWNLMGGYAGQVNLGLAAYFGTGALCYMLVYRAGAPLLVALVVGGLGATVVACIIGPPTLRLRGAYFGIGTMAMAEVLRLITTSP